MCSLHKFTIDNDHTFPIFGISPISKAYTLQLQKQFIDTKGMTSPNKHSKMN